MSVDAQITEDGPCLTYTVAKESGAPASEHSTETLERANLGKCLHVAPVESWVDLTAAFDQIQRSYRRMSKAL